jgi:hypothetical protein
MLPCRLGLDLASSLFNRCAGSRRRANTPEHDRTLNTAGGDDFGPEGIVSDYAGRFQHSKVNITGVNFLQFVQPDFGNPWPH